MPAPRRSRTTRSRSATSSTAAGRSPAARRDLPEQPRADGHGLGGPALPSRPHRLRRRARLAWHRRHPAARRRHGGRRHSPDLPARRRVSEGPGGKKMLGSVADGAVRLFPIGDDHLGIAEGIETALAAKAIFGVPVWAALSADGVAAGSGRTTCDASLSSRTRRRPGADGRRAARRAARRRGRAERVVTPLHDDDFNDDLRRAPSAAMERHRRRARGGVAAAPRAECHAAGRQPQRRCGRARKRPPLRP